jgi:hypothetical protein
MKPSIVEYIIVVVVFWAAVLLMAKHIDKVLGCLLRLALYLFVFLFTATVSALVVFLYYAWRQ